MPNGPCHEVENGFSGYSYLNNPSGSETGRYPTSLGVANDIFNSLPFILDQYLIKSKYFNGVRIVEIGIDIYTYTYKFSQYMR